MSLGQAPHFFLVVPGSGRKTPWRPESISGCGAWARPRPANQAAQEAVLPTSFSQFKKASYWGWRVQIVRKDRPRPGNLGFLDDVFFDQGMETPPRFISSL